MTPKENATRGTTTTPQFLIDIDLDQPYHFSTFDEREFNGETYVPGFVRLGRYDNDQCDLSIWNDGYRHTQNALGGVYQLAPITVWWAYGPRPDPHYVSPGYWQPGYTADPDMTLPEPMIVFKGFVYAFPQVDAWLSLVCRRHAPKLYPGRRLRPPFANFTPSAGYTIQFDDQVLKIEGRR